MAALQFLHITIFLAIFSSFIEVETQKINSRKLDETPPLENKCGNCPCDNPCNPPASPPPPSPPPPSPSPPPPSIPKNPPSSTNCPPPPSSQTSPGGDDKPPNTPYIYVNGPPGSVYSVYPYYSGGSRAFSVGRIIPFLIGGVVWVLAF